MAIYLAAGLAVTAALFIFTYYGFMRNQTQQAQLILQGETAYYLAQAGIAAGIASSANTRSPQQLQQLLTTADSTACNGASSEWLQLDSHQPLKELVADTGADAALAVEMSLAGFRPAYLQAESESGIVYNNIEKVGWLKVVATASVGPARRRIVAFKGIRVVCTVPYVVGKFTLFELEPEAAGAGNSNRLKYEKTTMTAGKPSDAGTPLPVSFHHGPGVSPEERGWIFLGGGPRKLNLTWGRIADGEEFQLLEKPWKVTADPAAPSPLPADHLTVIMEKGFFNGVKADNDLLDNFDFTQPPGDAVTENSALLHLYGTASEPSSTYVLGEVYRRFLSLRYLMRTSDGQYTYLPWSQPANWGPDPAPWRTAPPWNVRQDTFGGNLTAYSYYMSEVVEESYNRSADFIVPLQNQVDMPRTFISPGRVRHRFSMADFLYQPPFNNGDVFIRSTSGERLFDGNLHGLVMGDYFFPERATYALPASDFGSFLSLRQPRVPGILHFAGGDAIIDRPLVVRDGGVLAFDGKVTIAAPVTVPAGVRPLIIASLGSDIVINTPAPIQASLMALAGKIRGTRGGIDVQGSLVAGTVEWSTLLSNTVRSRVAWNPATDPTVPENRLYTVHMSPPRQSYMPGGLN